MATHVVEIPDWRPATVNELLTHPMESARLKRRDREVVWAYCKLANVPEARGRRRVSVRVACARGRPIDPDSIHKSLLDALVHAGALADDAAKWCELGPVVIERGPRMTPFTLEDLE
jgi:hypothetical protein